MVSVFMEEIEVGRSEERRNAGEEGASGEETRIRDGETLGGGKKEDCGGKEEKAGDHNSIVEGGGDFAAET